MWQLVDCVYVLVERYVSTLINEDYYYYYYIILKNVNFPAVSSLFITSKAADTVAT